MPGVADPAVRAIRDRWRSLTGGSGTRDADRRTLIACSGGADSTALALALATCRPAPILAHIVHDLRSREDALADRDAVIALAERLGLECEIEEIAVAGEAGNDEANAREARYRALERIASRTGFRYLATAHHADDQLETVLMRLLRGSGPQGLAGIRASRTLSECTLIRPMLSLSHAEAVRLCEETGVQWREDQTNSDTGRLRAAIRHRVLPILEDIAPGGSARAADAADLQQDLLDLLRVHTESLDRDGLVARGTDAVEFRRAVLAQAPEVVVGAVLRSNLGEFGRDKRSRQDLTRLVSAIRDGERSLRRFDLAGAAVEIEGDSVRISPATG